MDLEERLGADAVHRPVVPEDLGGAVRARLDEVALVRAPRPGRSVSHVVRFARWIWTLPAKSTTFALALRCTAPADDLQRAATSRRRAVRDAPLVADRPRGRWRASRELARPRRDLVRGDAARPAASRARAERVLGLGDRLRSARPRGVVALHEEEDAAGHEPREDEEADQDPDERLRRDVVPLELGLEVPALLLVHSAFVSGNPYRTRMLIARGGASAPGPRRRPDRQLYRRWPLRYRRPFFRVSAPVRRGRARFRRRNAQAAARELQAPQVDPVGRHRGLRDLRLRRLGDGELARRERTDTTLAAKAGSIRITTAEFQKEYAFAEERYRQAYGKNFSPELARAMNLPEQVLNGLIDRRLLREEADRLGIQVTDEELTQHLLGIKDPQCGAPALREGRGLRRRRGVQPASSPRTASRPRASRPSSRDADRPREAEPVLHARPSSWRTTR